MGYTLSRKKKWVRRAVRYLQLKGQKPILAELYRDVFEKVWLLDAKVKEILAYQTKPTLGSGTPNGGTAT